MNLMFFILFVAAIFIALLFAIALKIKLVFDTDKTNINMTLLWLDPLIKTHITIENNKPVLTLYIFNKVILKKVIRSKHKKANSKLSGMKLIKLTNPKDIHVNVNYGFKDPFTTGIACGVINMASQFINIDSINQTPDFLTTNDYIYLDANAKVNIGSTIINFLKSKLPASG